jgi:manganese/zinc/iron transport system permease protein
VRQRAEFAQAMLVIHLMNHEGRPEAAEESRVEHLHRHLHWEPAFAGRVVAGAQRRELVQRQDDDRLALTERGRDVARSTMGL